MITGIKRIIGPLTLISLISVIYWQFFVFGKIPIPTDSLSGGYLPWRDYKWGYQIGVPMKNPLLSDVFSQIYLWKNQSVRMMVAGAWPLWNPYIFSGTPLLANYQSSSFHPLNLLLLLPNNYGWGLFIFLQTIIAALGMYTLTGFYSKNNSSKIAGSLVFSLGGLMTTYVEFGIPVWSTAMLPWIIWSLEKYWNNHRLRYPCLLSFCFSILLLSGHAQLAFYSSILFLLFILTRFYTKKLHLNYILILIFFWIISLALCSIQLLPTIELGNVSIRSGDAPRLGYGLTPWYESIRLFAADFFGNPATFNTWDSGSNYHEKSSFIGTAVVPLIISFMIFSLKKRKGQFFLTAFLVTVVLNFENPISHWLYSQPLPMLTFSSASRILFIMIFTCGILTALAVDNIFKDDFLTLLKKINLLFLIIVASLFLYILFSRQFHFLSILNSRESLIGLRNLILPTILLIFWQSALFFVKNKKILGILFISMLFFDLGRYFLKYNPFVSTSLIFPETPAIDYLKKDTDIFRIARINEEVMPPNTWQHYGLSSIEGYDPMLLESYARTFNVIDGRSYSSAMSRYLKLHNIDTKYLNNLNVKYIITKKDQDTNSLPAANDHLKIVFEDKNTQVLENGLVLPRVYTTRKLMITNSRSELANILERKDFNPVESTVVLDGPQTELSSNSSGEVKNIQYGFNQISFNINSTHSFAVISESFAKGWKAFINNKPTKIYLSNGAFMGVLVPEGNYNIKLLYQPASFTIGLRITLVSLTTFICLIAFFVYKKII